MLPQPGTGSPSTDALSQIMRGRQLPMAVGDPGQGIGVGDGPMPQEAMWHSGPNEGIAPPPGEAMWHSSPTEGVAPPAAPIGSSSPTEGVMTNRDPAAPASTAAPAQAPVSSYGMARHGRRHMMHGGGGMSGTPALAGLHSLINGFGQGGY